jgi:hypothetical protein
LSPPEARRTWHHQHWVEGRRILIIMIITTSAAGG